MQDWEYEVADPARLREFLEAYESGELSEDERFTLMETIVASAEAWAGDLSTCEHWPRAKGLLDWNFRLHLPTVWYWSSSQTPSLEDAWRVAPEMRELLERHRADLDEAMVPFGPPEVVHVENEWDGGPRAGVANIGGVPHRFRSLFDEEGDEYLGTFPVWPLAWKLL